MECFLRLSSLEPYCHNRTRPDPDVLNILVILVHLDRNDRQESLAIGFKLIAEICL